MRKRIISIILAVAMILCLVPIGVLAAENDSNVNPATGRLQGPAGSEDVAVMVYGDTLSEYALGHEGGFDAFLTMLKAEAQNLLSNEEVPHAEMYLVNDQNQEYKLTENAVYDASFLSSFNYTADGILGFSETVFKWLQGAFGWVVQNVDSLQSLYRIYGATNVPEGNYTLEIRSLDNEGYTVAAPDVGYVPVTVRDDSRGTNYVGFEKYVGSVDLSFNVDLWVIDFDVDVLTAEFTMPGVFLDAVDPGVEFTSANLGDQPVPGSEFVMVNRDETEKIVKAAFSLGKDTFVNAMELLGTEGFTWEELSILHNEVLKWDKENAQISLDGKNAYKLLGTYWALVQASAKDPIIDFMSDETEIRLPAILKATADENGIVHFGPENNVTLVWSLEILMKMGGIALDKVEEYELIDEVFPDPATNGIIHLVIDLGRAMANTDTPLWDKDGNLDADNINTWIYPVLQNDSIVEYAMGLLKSFVGDDLSEDEKKILDLLPKHNILTKKMPAGKYILFETSVPDEYFRSPFFYTIDLQWHPEEKLPRDWYYASVADLGILLPYFAEDYYDWLRNYSFKTEADKVLNYITDGKTGDLITNTLTGKNDLTKYTITYVADLAYNYLGGKLLYSTEEDLAKDLTKHLYAYGKTAQNLLVFGDQVATRAKMVVTGEVNREWIFYNFSTSPRTNGALRTAKALKGVANAIDTTEDHPVTSGIKSIVARIADRIDTTNHIAGLTTKIKNAISDVISKVASSIGSKVLDAAFKAIKKVMEWSKL
ncbi:MAG: hypothetical protein J6Y62_05925 [Clostridia bacterium]|nr:hypothetical protein [Clostridia bacterium]